MFHNCTLAEFRVSCTTRFNPPCVDRIGWDDERQVGIITRLFLRVGAILMNWSRGGVGNAGRLHFRFARGRLIGVGELDICQ